MSALTTNDIEKIKIAISIYHSIDATLKSNGALTSIDIVSRIWSAMPSMNKQEAEALIKKLDSLDESRVGELERTLGMLVDTINITGGIRTNDNGFHAPAIDDMWSDLGDAYMEACRVLNKKPQYEGGDDDDPGQNE